jgi:hypothetical protein
MAFLIPLTILGSSMSGFMLGYYYNGGFNPDGECSNNLYRSDILDDDLFSKNILTFDPNNEYYLNIHEVKDLYKVSPFKHIHDEITTFKKESLKKSTSKSESRLSPEQELIEKLRKKISDRRLTIKPNIKKD